MSEPYVNVSEPNIVAIVPAAGVGKRMQATVAKQYLPLLNLRVIEHTLMPLVNCPAIKQVIVVVQADDVVFSTLAIAQHPKVLTTIGGKERADSVLNGLKFANQFSPDWALVHDAARPCLSQSDLTQLIEWASSKRKHGAILAAPVADTIKRVDHANSIVATVERSQLWRALTPQLFPFQQLIKALTNALEKKMTITDEASAIEADGGQCQILEGSVFNLKVTRPDDLALAKLILANQGDLTCE